MKNLIIIGASSNAKLAKFYFENDSEYKVVAFAVNKEYIDSESFEGLPVVPIETIGKTYPPEANETFVAVGYTNMNAIREELYHQVKSMGYSCPNYISSKCNFLTKEPIGDNNLILEDNTIQPFVKIGSNNVLWSGNHIGHDVIIENHNFITSHVVISGFTKILNNCFLGVNSTFRDGITIKNKSLVGAGAVIMNDTEEESVLLAPKPFKMDKKSSELKIS